MGLFVKESHNLLFSNSKLLTISDTLLLITSYLELRVMKRRDSGSRQERTTGFEQRLLVLFICWAPTSSNISLQQDKLDKILLTFQALSPVPPSPGSLGDHSQLWVGQTWGSLVCQRPLMSKVHWRWYHQWWNNHHVYLVPEHSFTQTRLCIHEMTTPHSPSSQILKNTTMISLAGSFPLLLWQNAYKEKLKEGSWLIWAFRQP